MHDHALERAAYALEPDMPEFPIRAHWDTRFQVRAPQPASCQAPIPPPTPRIAVAARNQAGGMVHRLAVLIDHKTTSPLPPPPRLLLRSGSNAPACGMAKLPVVLRPVGGGNAPARGIGRPPPPVLADGRHASVCGIGNPTPPPPPVPAGGRNALAYGPSVGKFIQPPPPAGLPPLRDPSARREEEGAPVPNLFVAAPVADAIGARRASMSEETLGTVDQFSQPLVADVGTALKGTVGAMARSGIASTIDGDESVSIEDDNMGDNLTAYLRAISAGAERPMSSHPMRTARALVIGALSKQQSDCLSVGVSSATRPKNS